MDLRGSEVNSEGLVMELLAAAPSEHSALLAGVPDDVLPPDTIALLLFGSHARRDAGPRSDVDLLALTRATNSAIVAGPYNISAYSRNRLSALISEGGLFALHLVTEGIVLADPDGVLTELLGGFEWEPEFGVALENALRTAAAIENCVDADWREHKVALISALVYLLRTKAYLNTVNAQHPSFSMEEALSVSGFSRDEALETADYLRMASKGSIAPTAECWRQLKSHARRLGIPAPHENYPSLRAMHVALAVSNPGVARFVLSIIAGRRASDYARLPSLVSGGL